MQPIKLPDIPRTALVQLDQYQWSFLYCTLTLLLWIQTPSSSCVFYFVLMNLTASRDVSGFLLYNGFNLLLR